MTPPLPPPVKGVSVTKGDGTTAQVVSVKDAAKLMAVGTRSIESWIERGRVTICVSPSGAPMVFVESLWNMVPKEFQNG